MATPRSRVGPDRTRSGLHLVPDLDPPQRACDDPALVLPGNIYAFPIWKISPTTGMVILYEADPATGQHLLDPQGKPVMVGQVPSPDMARADARPMIVWDYVGQTIRDLAVREAEHVEDKCWADVIAGRIKLVERGVWDKRTRDDKEIAAIDKIKPRFNKEYNEHNPHRIEIWRQVELRHARDDALHRERWLPLEQRSLAAQLAAERAVIGAGLDGAEPRYPLVVLGEALLWLWRHRGGTPRWLRTAGMLLLGWLALTVIIGAVLTSWLDWTSQQTLIGAAAASTALVAAAGGKKKRRRKRRR